MAPWECRFEHLDFFKNMTSVFLYSASHFSFVGSFQQGECAEYDVWFVMSLEIRMSIQDWHFEEAQFIHINIPYNIMLL